MQSFTIICVSQLSIYELEMVFVVEDDGPKMADN